MAKLMKEINFQITDSEVTGIYRFSAKIAKELKALRDATEECGSYNGETTYALYRVWNENGQWLAEFSMPRDNPEHDEQDAENSWMGLVDADLHTVGFYDN